MQGKWIESRKVKKEHRNEIFVANYNNARIALGIEMPKSHGRLNGTHLMPM